MFGAGHHREPVTFNVENRVLPVLPPQADPGCQIDLDCPPGLSVPSGGVKTGDTRDPDAQIEQPPPQGLVCPFVFLV